MQTAAIVAIAISLLVVAAAVVGGGLYVATRSTSASSTPSSPCVELNLMTQLTGTWRDSAGETMYIADGLVRSVDPELRSRILRVLNTDNARQAIMIQGARGQNREFMELTADGTLRGYPTAAAGDAYSRVGPVPVRGPQPTLFDFEGVWEMSGNERGKTMTLIRTGERLEAFSRLIPQVNNKFGVIVNGELQWQWPDGRRWGSESYRMTSNGAQFYPSTGSRAARFTFVERPTWGC